MFRCIVVKLKLIVVLGIVFSKLMYLLFCCWVNLGNVLLLRLICLRSIWLKQGINLFDLLFVFFVVDLNMIFCELMNLLLC